MKITKITYQKAFVVGPYLQEKIGVEIEVEPGEEDRAFREAVIKVGDWHRDANPHMYNGQPEVVASISFNGIIDIQHEKCQIAIENATTFDELLAVKDNFPLMTAPSIDFYNNRLKELTR